MPRIKKEKPEKVSEEVAENVEPLEEKVEVIAEVETPPQIVEGPKFFQPTAPKMPEITGETFEERLVFFLKGKFDFVRINDFLRIEYKKAIALQNVNKQIKAKLCKMVAEGTIEMRGKNYLKLGGFFYAGDSPETQYYTGANTIIEAKLK